MSHSTLNLSDLAAYEIRPALAEAHLLTDKHACDPVYIVTLTEELCRAERAIETMESSLQGKPSIESHEAGSAAPATPSAPWIRSKCHELHARLNRLEREFPDRLKRIAASERRRVRDRARTRPAIPPTSENDAVGGRHHRHISSSL
jgi:hypothetical protein